jgi:molecular chaperone GrpE
MTEPTPPTDGWDNALQDLVDDHVAPAPAEPEAAALDQVTEGELVSTPETMLAERTADLQRLQAEYVNYKKRVDRDRAVARQGGIEAVLTDLLPVLDGIAAARAHDELTGGLKLLADELAKIANKYGLESFGTVGDPFDPHIHEALMTVEQPGYSVTSVAQVFQSGYKLTDRDWLLRPARVAVAEPTEPESATAADEAAESAGVDSEAAPKVDGDDSATAPDQA